MQLPPGKSEWNMAYYYWQLHRNRQEDCQYVHGEVLYISSWLHQLCRAVKHGCPHRSFLGWHCVMSITYVHIVLFGILMNWTVQSVRSTFLKLIAPWRNATVQMPWINQIDILQSSMKMNLVKKSSHAPRINRALFLIPYHDVQWFWIPLLTHCQKTTSLPERPWQFI